jgi:hypothetical protein
MITEEDIKNHIAWFRYLHSANVLKERFEESLNFPEDDRFIYWTNPTSFVWLTYYYSSLYVVIEGWQKLKFKSPLIDFLLERQPGLLDGMRRFRNATFHMQIELESPKYSALLRTGKKHVLLVKLLHDSFVRYFAEWVDAFPGTKDQRTQFRDQVFAFVGWIPSTIKNVAEEMQEHRERFETELKRDDLSPAQRASALEIKAILDEFPQIAKNSTIGLDELREKMIKELFETDILTLPQKQN